MLRDLVILKVSTPTGSSISSWGSDRSLTTASFYDFWCTLVHGLTSLLKLHIDFLQDEYYAVTGVCIDGALLEKKNNRMSVAAVTSKSRI